MNRSQETAKNSSLREAASSVLARAFQDDPMMRYLIPDAARRTRLLPGFLGGVVNYCLSYGKVDVAPNLAGAACWLPPGETGTTFWRMLRSGMVPASLRLGPAGFGRLMGLTSYMDRLHERRMPDPHWYLWLLGVEPSSKGLGIGGSLLRSGLARADAARLPCYLETHNADNLKFYEKHGFRLADVAKASDRGIRIWTMTRSPGGDR
jgi:ribosomal protein S18 acetylase RimI-like enzyme